MLGQQNIINIIDKFNLSSLPQTILLEGPRGCGKHLLCNYISDKFNLTTQEIFDPTFDVITNISFNPTPNIYLIKGENLNLKQQNALLKIAECPPKGAYIIIYIEDKNLLIPTLLNRCYILKFNPYTLDVLNNFFPSNLNTNLDLREICDTPGKCLNLAQVNVESTYEMALKIINKLHSASLSNTLTIKDKINYKDEYDKIDLFLLLDTLEYLMFKKYVEEKQFIFKDLYVITSNYKSKFNTTIYSKEQLMYSYLIAIWKKIRGL